jgi:Family of unknown function (DUF6152)
MIPRPVLGRESIPLTHYEEKHHEAIIDGLCASRVRCLRTRFDDRIRSRENRQSRGNDQKLRLGHPYSWIEMEIPDGKGGAATWNVEMTVPGILANAGWKSNTIKPGDKVTVAFHPLLTGEPGGLFVSVTLADGKVMMERNPPPPAPAFLSRDRQGADSLYTIVVY